MSAAVSPSSHTVDWLRRLIGYQTVSGSESKTSTPICSLLYGC
jgi:hypothetical protein